MADLNSILNTPDTTSEFDAQDIEQNKVMAILAYLSWLVLIPIFAAKDSKFARYHANQGIILAIAEIVWWIVSGILRSIPVVGIIITIIDVIVELAFVLCLVLGLLNAANGKAKELPFIGGFTILK